MPSWEKGAGSRDRALESLQHTNQVLVSMQYVFTNNGEPSDSRAFSVVTYAELEVLVRDNRRLYECINPTRNRRLYFDLEHHRITQKGWSVKRMIISDNLITQRFLQAVKSVVGNFKCWIGDASDNKKFSRHAVVHLRVRGDIKSLVLDKIVPVIRKDPFLARYTELDQHNKAIVIMDAAVYDDHRQFRLVNQSKVNSTRFLNSMGVFNQDFQRLRDAGFVDTLVVPPKSYGERVISFQVQNTTNVVTGIPKAKRPKHAVVTGITGTTGTTLITKIFFGMPFTFKCCGDKWLPTTCKCLVATARGGNVIHSSVKSCLFRGEKSDRITCFKCGTEVLDKMF